MQTVYKRQRPRSYLIESFDIGKEVSLMISMERLRARINNEEPPPLPKRPTKLPYLAIRDTAKLKMQHPNVFDAEIPEYITRPRSKYERSLSITRLMYANKLQTAPGKRLLRKLKPLCKRKRNRMKKAYKMSIKIQRNYRRMQAQRKYTVARNVARRGLTQIQARIRGELQRKEFRKFLLQRKAEYAASIRIQNSFRLHAAKSKLARLKTEHEASVKIQNRFRVQKARGELRHRKIKRARANASVQIQSHIRAKFARDRAGVRRKRHKASVKIQNHIRRKKAWLKLERRREENARHNASLRIQAQFRANRARAIVCEYRNRRIAAVQIQALVRMQQAVKRTTIRRARHFASVKIESQFRRKKARDKFNRMKAQKLEGQQRAAATKIQKLVRGNIAKNKLHQLRKEKGASTKIQSHIRGKLTRKRMVAQANAATEIQKIIRGQAAQAQFAQRMELRRDGATKLQAQVRRWQQHARFTRASRISRTIQAQWRAHKARKTFRKMRDKRDSTLRVQRVWRGHLVRAHLQRKRDAATDLQRGWRGFLGKRCAAEARRCHRARRLQQYWRRRRCVRRDAAAVRLQSFFRAQAQRGQHVAILDAVHKIIRFVRAYSKTEVVSAAPNKPDVTAPKPDQVLRETLNALMEDKPVQDVVGSFWETLPGITARETTFVVRDRQASAFKLDMQGFLAVNRIFYLALTPEEEANEEALEIMDTDAVNHWKRYVGADTAMERVAFARYVLDIVSLYVEPVRNAGQSPTYASGSFVTLLKALYKATVHNIDAAEAYPFKVYWAHDVSHSALLRCLLAEHISAVLSSSCRGAELTAKFQLMASQCTGAFFLTDTLKHFQRLETLRMVLLKALLSGRTDLVKECQPRVLRLKVTNETKSIAAGSALREQLDAIVGEYSALQAVETGMHLGPKLESTLPVWRLANNESTTAPHIFATVDLHWHFSDLNFSRWFTSKHAAPSPLAVTSWTSSEQQVEVSVVATKEHAVMDSAIASRKQKEVPLLRLDHYGHLLRHMLQDTNLDTQVDAVDTVRTFAEQNDLLHSDFFTAALWTLHLSDALQDEGVLEWYDVTEEIVNKPGPLQAALEATAPWVGYLRNFEDHTSLSDGEEDFSGSDWDIDIM